MIDRGPRAPHWTSFAQLPALLGVDDEDLRRRVAAGELWLATAWRPTPFDGDAALGGCADAIEWDAPPIWYLAPADALEVLSNDDFDATPVHRLYTSNGPICCGLEGPNCRAEARARFIGLDLFEEELDGLQQQACTWWEGRQPSAAGGVTWWHDGDAVSPVIGWVDLRRPLLLEAEDLFLPEEERAWWTLDGPGRDRKDPQRQAAALERQREPRELAQHIAANSWREDPEQRIGALTRYVVGALEESGHTRSEKTVRAWIAPLAPAGARRAGRPRKV